MTNPNIIFTNNFLTITYKINESNESNLEFNYLFFEVLKGTPTQQESHDVYEFIVDLYYDYDRKCLKVALLFNLSKLIYLSPNMLKQWTSFFIENMHITNRIIIASSIILEKSIIKHFLNMFFSVYNPVKPLRFVKDEDQAIKFIKSVILQYQPMH